MYRITLHTNGKFFAECMVQNGTKRKLFGDIDEAVSWLKLTAKDLNGVVIKRKDVSFLKMVPVMAEKVVKTSYEGMKQ